MRTASFCTALAVMTISFNSADAADLSSAPSARVVKYADLDLAREAGIAALYGRLRSAAREVCQPLDPHDLASLDAARRCERQAIERAVADVGAPALTSYYRRAAGQTIVLAQRR
jgi:UrcA family protein